MTTVLGLIGFQDSLLARSGLDLQQFPAYRSGAFRMPMPIKGKRARSWTAAKS